MSRIVYADDCENPAMYLWDSWMKRAIRGKRGQAILKELREALLAMPEKRLIHEYLIHLDEETGECHVCALGALAVHRLQRDGQLNLKLDSGRYIVEDLEDLDHRWSFLDDIWSSQEVGEQMGLSKMLTWALVEVNDEDVSSEATDEERWQCVFRWVESQIHA